MCGYLGSFGLEKFLLRFSSTSTKQYPKECPRAYSAFETESDGQFCRIQLSTSLVALKASPRPLSRPLWMLQWISPTAALLFIVSFAALVSESNVCNGTSNGMSFPAGSPLLIASNQQIVLDGCVFASGALQNITSSVPLTNVTIIIQNCVGLVPQIEFRHEALNISIAIRNLSMSSGDLRTANALITFFGTSSWIVVSFQRLHIAAIDAITLGTLVAFLGNSSHVAVALDQSSISRMTASISPLILFQSYLLSFIDVAISNANISTVQIVTMEVRNRYCGTLVQWIGFDVVDGVATAIRNSTVDTVLSMEHWEVNLGRTGTFDTSVIDYRGYTDSNLGCHTISFTWRNISVAVSLSNVTHRYLASDALYFEVGVALASVSSIEPQCPISQLPVVIGLSCYVDGSTLTFVGTLATRMLSVEPFFDVLKDVNLVIRNVRYVGIARGVLPSTSSWRLVVMLDVKSDMLRANISIVGCHITLTAPMGNLPVLPSSPSFGQFSQVWRNQSVSPVSNFSTSGAAVARVNNVLNSSLLVLDSTIEEDMSGTMLNRAVTIPERCFASCQGSILTVRSVSQAGSIRVINSSLLVTVASSSIDPIFVLYNGVVAATSDMLLIGVSLAAVANTSLDELAVVIDCHNSALTIVWDKQGPLPSHLVTMSSFFAMMGTGLFVNLVLSSIPIQWRAVFANTDLSRFTGGGLVVASHIDMNLTRCSLLIDLPPPSSSDGTYVFPSVLGLPNDNKALVVAVSNVSISWSSWVHSLRLSPLLSMIAFPSGNSTLEGCSMRFDGVALQGNRSAVDSCVCLPDGCGDCNAVFDGGTALAVEGSRVKGVGVGAYAMTWVRPRTAQIAFTNDEFVDMEALFGPQVVVASSDVFNLTLRCDKWNSVAELDVGDIGGNLTQAHVVIKPCSNQIVAPPKVRLSQALSASVVISCAVAGPTVTAGIQVISQTLALYQRCLVGDDGGDPPMSDASSNPFGFVIPSLGDEEQFAGGSVLSWALASVILFLFTNSMEIIQNRCRKSRLSVATLLGLPGTLYIPFLLVLQPWSAAAVVLIAAPARSVGSVVFGCAVVMGVLGSSLCFLWRVVPASNRAMLQWRPKHLRVSPKRFHKAVEKIAASVFEFRWQCFPRSRSSADCCDYFGRYGCILSSFREARGWFPAVEIGAASMSGLLCGLALTGPSNSSCTTIVDATSWALAGLSLAQFIAVLLLRPYSAVFDNVQSCESSLLTATSLVVLLLWAQAVNVVTILTWIQTAVTFLPILFRVLFLKKCTRSDRVVIFGDTKQKILFDVNHELAETPLERSQRNLAVLIKRICRQ